MASRKPLATLTALLLAPAALAQPVVDADTAMPRFQEGDIITFDQINKLTHVISAT